MPLLTIHHKTETGQPEPDPRNREGRIRDHPGRIPIITAPRLFPHQRNILLSFQRTGKKTGRGERVAPRKDIDLPVEVASLFGAIDMSFKVTAPTLPAH